MHLHETKPAVKTNDMIQVVTTIDVLPDCVGDFLAVLGELTPHVLAEPGCLAYQPMVDAPAGLATQNAARQHTVVLLETWAGLDALHAHMASEHMGMFREAAGKYVAGVSHQVLRPV